MTAACAAAKNEIFRGSEDIYYDISNVFRCVTCHVACAAGV